ncbi:MAG: Bacterial SH3 domain [Phormidesmis priestleyi Ana]|uniref:Bacterial SH3 domain n=1 Tax=Phormidesmis priestleyi Ana TaxID=1666911 RepID=A0A0P8DKB0_9CYAN|nr:MAG: Bacterial SH3 domain [Phormidesmis priestleyi Ana]
MRRHGDINNMVMKNFLIGLSKFVLGIILAMLIMSLAGLSMVRYFMTRMVEPPDRPSYENDLPEDQRPVAQSPTTAAAGTPETANAGSAAAPELEPQRDENPEGSYSASATTNLNLRSGPGTSYDSIGGVGIDESVTVIGEDSGWLNVLLSDGNEGWVSANYITAE